MVTPWKQVYSSDMLGAWMQHRGWRDEELSGFSGISRSCSVDLSRLWAFPVNLGINLTMALQQESKMLFMELGRSGYSRETNISPALLSAEPGVNFCNSVSPYPLVWIFWEMLTRCSIAFLLINPLGPGILTALTLKLGILNISILKYICRAVP